MAAEEVKGAPLKWTAVFDYQKAEQEIDAFYKRLQERNKNTAKSGDSPVNLSAQKQAQIAVQEALRNTRLETANLKKEQQEIINQYSEAKAKAQEYKAQVDALKVSEQDLKNTYAQGKIDAQEYALAQKKISDAQKLSIEAQKESDRQAREAQKNAEAQLRIQRQQDAIAQKNKKRLEQENSEYHKLSQALNLVRKEAKDVLAEMFRLENQGGKNTQAYRDLQQESQRLVRQTQYLDNGIKRIDASLGLHQRNVGNYSSALSLISPQFDRINSLLFAMGTSLDNIVAKKNPFAELGQSVVSLGRNLGKFLISPIGLATTALLALYALIRGNGSTVVQFNSQLLNIGKTTGLAGRDLNNLGDSLINLSRKLQTVDVSSLQEYATVAGQLGVRGTRNILAFSEALAKLETATNISGEEGASSIARLLTLTDGGVQNVQKFGDEIVNLGNNFAATESEILGNATRIAQSTGIYKLGRQEVLAYATATKAVGVEAELVGSTFGRTLGIFEKQIRTGKGVNALLQITGKSAKELKDQFAESSSSVFNDFVRGLNQIQKSGGSVNQALSAVGITAQRDQAVIGSLATRYDVLANALSKVSSSGGSLDEEFSTASRKIENQLSRISIAWHNLVLSIENGTGVFGRAAVRIAGMIATAIEGLNKLTDLTKDQVDFRGDQVKEFSVAPYKERVEWLQREEKVYNSMVKDYRAGNKELLKDLNNQKKLVDDLRKAFKKINDEESAARANQPPVNGINLDDETEKEKRAREAAERRREEALRRQRELQADIDKINKTAQRKQLTSDEEEIQAIRDKYAEIRRVVNEFYKSSRNTGLKVDTSGLTASQAAEEDEARAKQQIDKDKQLYAQRKVLFEEYQEYMGKVGKEAADERFKEELGGFESYVQYLKSLVPAQSDTSVLANKRRDELQKEIAKAQKEELKQQQELYTESLIAAQTYSQRIIAIRQKLARDINMLGENASSEQINALKRNAQERISEETSANLKIELNWEATFSTLIKMSQKAARDYIKEVSRRLDYERRIGNLTKEEYIKRMKEIEEATMDLDQRNPFEAVKRALDDYRKSVRQFGSDSNDAKTKLRSLAGVASQALMATAEIVSNLGESFATLGIGGDALQETLSKIQGLLGGLSQLSSGISSGNVVDIISGSIKTLTSVIDLFNTKDKKLQKQIKGYQDAIKALQIQYDELQRSISESVGESYYSDSTAAINNLQEQIRNLTAARDAEIKKKKTDQDAVDSYNDSIRQAQNAIEDLQNSISRELLQTDFKELSQNIADALVSAFEQGENAIDALDDTWDKFIKNAVANSLKLKIIEPLIADVTKQLTDYMLANNNSLTGFNFTDIKNRLDNAGKEFTDALDKAYEGLGLSTDATKGNSNTLSGSIQRDLTEETGTILAGLYRAQYDMTKNHFAEAQIQSEILRSQMKIANDNLDVARRIEINTGEAVIELRTVVKRLDSISENTSTNKTMRGVTG